MVASSDSGEGKSFITLALAHFAAAAGRRVLVLECDLRQPSMGRTLGLPFGPGLSEVLRGEITPEQAVRASSVGGLDIILAGRPAVDSAELLSGARMRQILAWASTRYDPDTDRYAILAGVARCPGARAERGRDPVLRAMGPLAPGDDARGHQRDAGGRRPGARPPCWTRLSRSITASTSLRACLQGRIAWPGTARPSRTPALAVR